MHGRTYDEQRFSPLIDIDRDNVSHLGLAWYFDVPTKRGMEATPIVVDGRMYVTGSWSVVYALDAKTGEERWRFYTVPGNPEGGFENEVLEKAASTWTGEWWNYGGGGTVWDSIAYDPELDLLYIGVGNGSPWNRDVRSPDGGDNLFLSSIVALRPATGVYVWHYQTTPGDNWDYTATQHMTLADLEIDGEPRKVLMQAPSTKPPDVLRCRRY